MAMGEYLTLNSFGCTKSIPARCFPYLDCLIRCVLVQLAAVGLWLNCILRLLRKAGHYPSIRVCSQIQSRTFGLGAFTVFAENTAHLRTTAASANAVPDVPKDEDADDVVELTDSSNVSKVRASYRRVPKLDRILICFCGLNACTTH